MGEGMGDTRTKRSIPLNTQLKYRYLGIEYLSERIYDHVTVYFEVIKQNDGLSYSYITAGVGYLCYYTSPRQSRG